MKKIVLIILTLFLLPLVYSQVITLNTPENNTMTINNTITFNASFLGTDFPVDDIISYYKMNGTTGAVIDWVGNYNGTIIPSGAYDVIRGVPGIINASFNFSANSAGSSGAYINLSDANGQNGNGGNCLDWNCTISMWVNLSVTGGRWIYTESGTQGYEGSFSLRHNGGQLQCSINLTEFCLTPDYYNNGLWQHVVYVLNGTSALSYINNTFINSTNIVSAPSNNNGAIAYFNARPSGLSDPTPTDFARISLDEIGIWNRSLTTTEIDYLYNSGSGKSYSNTADLNNFTLTIFEENNTVFARNTTNLTGSSNLTTWVTSFLNNHPRKYYWNVEACLVDGTCSTALQNFTFLQGLSDFNSIYKASVYETETGYYNITFNSTSPTLSGNLWWNGTSYGATSSQIDGNLWMLETNFDIPVSSSTEPIGSKNLLWEIITNGFIYNTSVENQGYALTNLSLCGLPHNGNPFINFTFSNETTGQEKVDANIPSSTYTFWLGTGTTNKTNTYSSSSENPEYTFCATPENETLSTDISLSFSNSYSQQRNYNPDTLTLTNDTTDKTLFLLPTSDGIFVTFQVINSAEQPINGAEVTLARTGFGDISQTLTGASGTTTVFLNPNFQYELTITKSGYQSFSASQTFPNSEYTISLGSASASTNVDLTRGVEVRVRPRAQTLFNNTVYEFNMSMNSTFWTLDSWGYNIYNSTNSLLASNSSTSSNGFLSSQLDTGNNSLLKMNYYWEVNNSYINFTTIWGIDDESGGSIKGFFTRLSTYLSQGIFGIDSFGIALIIFLTIFLTTASLSWSFGLTSPISIFAITTLGVIFFDIIGLLDVVLGAFSGVVSGIMVLVLISMIIMRLR